MSFSISTYGYDKLYFNIHINTNFKNCVTNTVTHWLLIGQSTKILRLTNKIDSIECRFAI